MMRQKRFSNIKIPVLRPAQVFLIFLTATSLGAQPLAKRYHAGVTHFENANFKEAIELFTQVIEQDATYYEAYFYRGRCYAGLGDTEAAMADLDMTIDLEPGFYAALFQRGELYYQLGDTRKAMSDLVTALDNRPDLSEAHYLLGDIFMQDGKLEEAIQRFNLAQQYGSERPELYLNRALCRMGQQDWESAERDLSDAITLRPTYGEAFYLRAVCRKQRHILLGAVEDANLAISNGYEKEQAYRLRADLNFGSKRWQAALKDYRWLEDEYKVRNDTLYLNMGICLYKLRRYEDAIEDFNHALARNRTNALAVTYRGDCWLELDKVQAALRDYNKAIAMDDKNARAYAQRGRIHFLMENYREAVDDLDKAIRLEPTAEAYYYRGATRDLMNDRKGACEDLRKAADMRYMKAIAKSREICR